MLLRSWLVFTLSFPTHHRHPPSPTLLALLYSRHKISHWIIYGDYLWLFPWSLPCMDMCACNILDICLIWRALLGMTIEIFFSHVKDVIAIEATKSKREREQKKLIKNGRKILLASYAYVSIIFSCYISMHAGSDVKEVRQIQFSIYAMIIESILMLFQAQKSSYCMMLP